TTGGGGARDEKWPPASDDPQSPPGGDPPPSLATYSRSARRGDTASELTSVAGSAPPPVSCCQLAPASRVANRPVFVPMSSDRGAWLLARAATMLLPPTTAPGAPTGTAVQFRPPSAPAARRRPPSALLTSGSASPPRVPSPPAITVAPPPAAGRMVSALTRTWGRPALDHRPPSRLAIRPSSPAAMTAPPGNAKART